MRHFKSQESIRDAGLEELAAAPGMNQGAARQVYEFFHGKKE